MVDTSGLRTTRLRVSSKALAMVAVIALVVVALGVDAQAAPGDSQLDWAATSNGDASGSAVAVDAAGTTYVTGSFSGTVDFDPGSGQALLTSAGSFDAFVAVYDVAGNLVRAQSIGDTGTDAGCGIAVDAAGNTYVVGSFRDSVDFDLGAGQALLSSAGSTDVFVAVYDSAGDFVWAHSIGGPEFDSGCGIAVDAAGAAHVTGSFGGTVDFDPGVGQSLRTSAGGSDGFVAVYDSAGGFVWAHSIGDNDFDGAEDVAVDAAGNTHVMGDFEGTVDFDPGAGQMLLSSAGGSDVFLAVYDSEGDLVRARSMGGADPDVGLALAMDAAGSTYVTGYFYGTADFDPGPGVLELTADAFADVFVAVYDSAGDLVRVHSMGGDGLDLGRGVAVDAAGNTHVTGNFNGTVDFDPGVGQMLLSSAGGNDVFVAVYDSVGNLVRAHSSGDTNTDAGLGVAADAAGNSYVTGLFEDTVDFDPGPGQLLFTAIGASDMFVARYSTELSPPVAADDAVSTGFETAVAVNVVDGSAGGADTDPDGDVLSVSAVSGFTNGTATFTGETVTYTPDAGFTGTDTGTYTVSDPGGLTDTAMLAVTVGVPAVFCDGLAVTIDLNITPGAVATGGDDVILGTPGNDVINGLGGSDTICGEDGDDMINGGGGNDSIYGGAGNDTMFGGDGNDRIRGQQGIDNINGEAGRDGLFGGIDGDTINGGTGNDFIGGFGGADTINGGDGNDRIFGGFGADTINGDDGDDNINGLIGNDIINGGNGDDLLNGDQGQDTIHGDDGNDTIKGGNSLDNLFGDADNDTINGGKSDDTLNGGAGTDTCTGNTGTDTADASCETIFGVP